MNSLRMLTLKKWYLMESIYFLKFTYVIDSPLYNSIVPVQTEGQGFWGLAAPVTGWWSLYNLVPEMNIWIFMYKAIF